MIRDPHYRLISFQSIVKFMQKQEGEALSEFNILLDNSRNDNPLVSKIKDIVQDHYLEGGEIVVGDERVVDAVAEAKNTLSQFNNYHADDCASPYSSSLLLGDNNIRVNKYHITNGGVLFRMTSANLNLNYSIKFDCLNGGVNAYGFENIIKRLKFLNYNKNDFIVVTLILGNFYRNFIQIESLPYFTKTNDHLFKANIELFSFLIDKIRNKLRFKSNFRNFEKKENLDILKIKIKNDFNLLKEFLDNNSNILIFFSGIDLLPPLAGIKAIMLISVFCISAYLFALVQLAGYLSLCK